MPRLFWMASRASSARAEGLTSYAMRFSHGLSRKQIVRNRRYRSRHEQRQRRDSARTAGGGRPRSLHWLLIDMIEEYARHVGHADLIREAVDGLVGEDPPE